MEDGNFSALSNLEDIMESKSNKKPTLYTYMTLIEVDQIVR